MPTDARVFAAGAWILPTLVARASEGHDAAGAWILPTLTAQPHAGDDATDGGRPRVADTDRGRPHP
jgi:hypothetical protein